MISIKQRSSIKLIFSILLVQAIGVVFVQFRDQALFYVTHLLIWFALAMIVYLLIRQPRQAWQSTEISVAPRPWHSGLKIAALFLFFLLFSWQINYLSLYQSQPLMYTAESVPVRYDMLAGDLLGYTLRMALQAWCLALALALVFNLFPKQERFGFLRGDYQKLSSFVWYLGSIAGVAIYIMALFSLGLLVLDIGKFICKSLGADVMILPQFDLVVLFFSLYLFNIAMGFTKKLKAWSKEPGFSVMSLVALQLLFVLFVYCMVNAMMQFLPEDTVLALMEPFYFEFLDYKKYPGYWQLFITCLSVFMVPLLASYIYHACKGQSVLRSSVRMLIIPAVLCLVILLQIPSAQVMFYEFSPTVNMFTVVLNNETSRYVVSWLSYFSSIILMVLILMLQRSESLLKALAEVMPPHAGRRQKRIKAFYVKSYPFFITLMVFYLLGGAVVSLYFSSLFLLTTLLGLGLCFVAGFQRQEI